MTNSQITVAFFAVIDAKTKGEILRSVAQSCSVTVDEALAEVTHPDAESLLDYLSPRVRQAVSVLMQRHGLRGTTAQPRMGESG